MRSRSSISDEGASTYPEGIPRWGGTLGDQGSYQVKNEISRGPATGLLLPERGGAQRKDRSHKDLNTPYFLGVTHLAKDFPIPEEALKI